MHANQCLIAAAVLAFGLPAIGQEQQGAKDAPKTDTAKPDAAKPDAKKPEPPKDKTFADVIKDSTEIKGLFTLYRTEEKVYLELLPDQLDKIYMVSLTCDSGLGERGFFAAAMCGEVPIVFRKQGKNIQAIVKNPRFTAQPESPMERAVARSFSDSAIGIAKIESLPHPDRKSVLIDLGSLLLADLPMMSFNLEATFRIPYRFDSKHSSFGKIKAFEKNVEIDVAAHYAAERPLLPPIPSPGSTPPPAPPPPRNLPDVRSLFVHYRYSLSELPGPGYRPRLADDRVGHFFDQAEDFSSDVRYSPSRRYISRWRLEKQDPAAPLSPPKQPIVFWMENTIPVQYRGAIRDGALMWNKAFERIGFKDAIVVKQQPDDADWDPADVRYSTIRWFAGTESAFAQGPSRTNPYTGEIYDADIRFMESMTRFRRRQVVEEQNPLTAWETGVPPVLRTAWSKPLESFCTYANDAVRDAEFAMDVIEARGIEPDSPEADKFVSDWLREISAHEVGHTLGLRHNFRASTIHSWEQAQDAQLTAKEGLTGSVMDYIPSNVGAQGGKQGEYHQTTLGPYDFWVIEYAYKPIAASGPDAEWPELQKIASRSAEPALAYGTDEDAGFSSTPWDMDPEVNRNDLGSDPLRYYSHRVNLSEEIFAKIETKLQKSGEGYQVLRRSFNSALGQKGYSLRMAAKYIGGVNHYRDHVGDPGGRLPFQPVPAARQKEALKLLRDHLFAPEAFRFSPQLLNKLNNERFPTWTNIAAMQTRFDVPVHDMVLDVQKSVMGRVYHPVVLKRILDSELTAPKDGFRLGDLFTGIQDAVWAETAGTGAALSINSFRRELQREHLRRAIGMVLRDSAVPEDARTMSRQSLVTLRGRIQSALSRPGVRMPVETRAHLSESVARIDETLKANMQRTAF
jgi:hypothetical protein